MVLSVHYRCLPPSRTLPRQQSQVRHTWRFHLRRWRLLVSLCVEEGERSIVVSSCFGRMTALQPRNSKKSVIQALYISSEFPRVILSSPSTSKSEASNSSMSRSSILARDTSRCVLKQLVALATSLPPCAPNISRLPPFNKAVSAAPAYLKGVWCRPL